MFIGEHGGLGETGNVGMYQAAIRQYDAAEFAARTKPGGLPRGGPEAERITMHIHDVHFQVVDRQVAPAFAEAWESVRYGFVDDGWKDTVAVMPGEQVKVLVRFQDFAGVYLHHCHNLEHEDQGMMRNFRVDP